MRRIDNATIKIVGVAMVIAIISSNPVIIKSFIKKNINLSFLRQKLQNCKSKNKATQTNKRNNGFINTNITTKNPNPKFKLLSIFEFILLLLFSFSAEKNFSYSIYQLINSVNSCSAHSRQENFLACASPLAIKSFRKSLSRKISSIAKANSA